MPLNSRLETLGDNPFVRLTQLLAEVPPKEGLTPIVMSVGEPQHATPPLVERVLAENSALWNRYPPIAGTAEFREAAAQWLIRRYNLPSGLISAERHILPLAGTKEGLFMAAAAIVPETKAGARPVVLMPNPFYQVYRGAAVMAGAVPIYLDATADTGFLPDLDAIPAEILARTALFYLGSPSNPQGAIADIAYLRKAIELARTYDFVLIVDECYSEIYRDVPPPGILEAYAALSEKPANVLAFHSLSKRSNAAGLRAGFVAGDGRVIAALLRLRNYGGAQIPLPIQAAAAALLRDESHVEENRARYRRKFDIAESILQGKLGFYRPQGGFLLWLDAGDGEAAALRLWREAAVRVLPGPYLARPDRLGVNPGQRYIRVALVHDEPIVAEGLERLKRVLC